MRRAAFSLLELIIAMAIFGTVMTITGTFLTGSRLVLDPDAARDDLTMVGDRAIATLTRDLTNAAWFYDWVDSDADGEVDAGETVNYVMPKVNPAWQPVIGALQAEGCAYDKAGVKVSQKDPGIDTDVIPTVWYDAGGNVVTGPPLSGSGRLWGDRLVFTRLQTTSEVRNRPELNAGYLAFAGPNLVRPVRMSRYMDAPPVPGMVLNPAAAGLDTNFVTQRWESDKANDFTANRLLANLRTFAYTVQPSRRTGTARLVRSYRNAAPWSTTLQEAQYVEDEEICDWVESVRFDTRNTNADLATNQVRVLLVLRKPTVGALDLAVTRRFEATIAMRSITYED